MGLRRRARVIAFQSIYRYDFTNEPVEKLLDFSWLGEEEEKALPQEVRDFAHLLISGTINNLAEIDELINSCLQGWTFKRLARVDVANLRINVFGLLYLKDVPHTVTIDEAVDIAKEFGSDDSYRFINGILDNIHKMIGSRGHNQR